MDNLVTDDLNIPSELSDLNKYLPGKIEISYDIHTLMIDPSYGKGKVRFTSLQNGLQTYDFDIELSKDIAIPISAITINALQFLYCLEAYCFYHHETSVEKIKIEQFQTAIIHSNSESSNYLFIKKNSSFKGNIISIDKTEYFGKVTKQSNQFDRKIQDLLSDVKNKLGYFHLGSYNLKIAEQLKLLLGIEHKNEISELLSQKGRYYLLLAKHIEQFYAEVENKSNTSGLLKNELISISELGEFIRNHPEIQHSIKSLCIKSGISPAKLQEGFKFIYSRTVSDYVRNVRLEKAEKLIRNTDLSISEVVYSVGLTSRSYFCKIFKRKNFCSPKEYRLKKPYSDH